MGRGKVELENIFLWFYEVLLTFCRVWAHHGTWPLHGQVFAKDGRRERRRKEIKSY